MDLTAGSAQVFGPLGWRSRVSSGGWSCEASVPRDGCGRTTSVGWVLGVPLRAVGVRGGVPTVGSGFPYHSGLLRGTRGRTSAAARMPSVDRCQARPGRLTTEGSQLPWPAYPLRDAGLRAGELGGQLGSGAQRRCTLAFMSSESRSSSTWHPALMRSRLAYTPRPEPHDASGVGAASHDHRPSRPRARADGRPRQMRDTAATPRSAPRVWPRRGTHPGLAWPARTPQHGGASTGPRPDGRRRRPRRRGSAPRSPGSPPALAVLGSPRTTS